MKKNDEVSFLFLFFIRRVRNQRRGRKAGYTEDSPHLIPGIDRTNLSRGIFIITFKRVIASRSRESRFLINVDSWMSRIIRASKNNSNVDTNFAERCERGFSRANILAKLISIIELSTSAKIVVTIA